MRLISQNEARDIPYDSVSLYIKYNPADKDFRMATINCRFANGDVEEIAIYDTCKTALKVMEVLRQQYTLNPPTAYFQFPDRYNIEAWFAKQEEEYGEIEVI